MEYGKIVAVTGLPGLYELLSSKTDGAIVRSLDDKSTKFVSSRVHNFSHLESIEVFTVRENVNLSEIFKAMEKGEDKIPDNKDGGKLKSYFEKVYPDLDFERVYSSDLKKMAKWFEVLKQNNVEIVTTPEQEETPEEPVVEKKEMEKKAEKKTAAKKTEKAAATAEPEATEPKKVTAKKKAEPEKPKEEKTKPVAEKEQKPAKKAAAKKKTKE